MAKSLPTVLFVVAHPDDVILGCAGTFLLLCRSGAQIAQLSLTQGEAAVGAGPDDRPRELRQIYERYLHKEIAAGQLRLLYGGLKDTAIPATSKPVKALESIIAESCPGWKFDLAVLHWLKDWHADHINAARIGHGLARRIPSVLYFESWSSMEFPSAVCIDITRYWQQRLEMIESLKIHPQAEAIPRLSGRAMYHGATIRKQYAEAFATPRFDPSVLAACFMHDSASG